jgi:signal recognition particle subunit SRP54
MMKAMNSAKRGPMAGLAGMLGLGSGVPSPEQMQKLAEKMPGALPGGSGAPGLPPRMPGLPPNFPGGPPLPGLSGKPPGLGGFPGFGKKK